MRLSVCLIYPHTHRYESANPAQDIVTALNSNIESGFGQPDGIPTRSDTPPSPTGRPFPQAGIDGVVGELSSGKWATSIYAADPRSASVSSGTAFSPEARYLQPNILVCTTAVKAYGRLKMAYKAKAILTWMEDRGINADVFFLSALLYVMAKGKNIAFAEKIFWEEFPRRNLTYSVATTNSLMYMYARLNRADDALKVTD